MRVVNESLAAGGWTKGSSQKRSIGMQRPNVEVQRETRPNHETATSADYDFAREHNKILRELEMYINYGRLMNDTLENRLQYVNLKKHSVEFVKAYAALYVEHVDACRELDLMRPLPVVTKIGVSPTVTKTFTEMNLNLDLASIKLAEIAFRLVPWLDNKGNKAYKENGDLLMTREYYVKWSKGIKHGQSRFSAVRKHQCEACGHGIPSGNFVAVEAFDKNLNNQISLWVGCDCAKNIFGIKDVGIKRTQE